MISGKGKGAEGNEEEKLLIIRTITFPIHSYYEINICNNKSKWRGRWWQRCLIFHSTYGGCVDMAQSPSIENNGAGAAAAD